jgi:hypothetical protein
MMDENNMSSGPEEPVFNLLFYLVQNKPMA